MVNAPLYHPHDRSLSREAGEGWGGGLFSIRPLSNPHPPTMLRIAGPTLPRFAGEGASARRD